MSCLMNAWETHESELRHWLRGRLGNAHDAEDMLQDLFLKAIRQDRKFCEIDNARAWLFEVARNAVADRLRLKRAFVYVKRRAAPHEAKRVAALDLDGVGFLKESKRFYPNRELAAHLLGYVGLDNVGLHGVEAAYDKVVRGRPGTSKVT